MNAEHEFDLGIRCDYLVSMASSSIGEKHARVERDFFIGIRGSDIVKIAPWTRTDGKPWAARKLIHAKDQVVIPGLINGHTHLGMTLFRGLADDLPFTEWLYDYILPTERKFVSAEFVRIGTELAALECIRAGTTSVCDMYFFGEAVGDVIDRSGLRGMIAQALTIHPTPDNPQPSPELPYQQLDRLRAKYSLHQRIIPMIAPHAPYSCTDEMLARAGEYARDHDCPLVIHVAETRHELEESLKKYGKTPVQRLHDLGVLGPRAILAHCVHLTDEDMDLMVANGASAIYNPESNMKLGVGVAPIPRMLKRGMKVGIGTDGSASNNDLSLFKEMDAGAKLQKLSAGDTTAMTATQALRLATIDGARALGLDQRTGSLEEGKSADLAIIDLKLPHMQPVHDVVSQLVYSATGAEVSTVVCAGQILMEDRQIKTLDSERIYSEVQDMLARIKSSLA